MSDNIVKFEYTFNDDELNMIKDHIKFNYQLVISNKIIQDVIKEDFRVVASIFSFLYSLGNLTTFTEGLVRHISDEKIQNIVSDENVQLELLHKYAKQKGIEVVETMGV